MDTHPSMTAGEGRISPIQRALAGTVVLTQDGN